MKRSYSVELLRFLAAIAVCILHYWNYDNTAYPYLCYYGNLAVDFFFLISGFFMAMHAYKVLESRGKELNIGKETLRYTGIRISRFYFPFLIVWLIRLVTEAAQTPSLHIFTVEYGRNLLNHIFEVLLLENAGFDSGAYYVVQMWYISALLLVGLVCYPLLLKLRESYLYAAAPLTAFMILGYLYHQYGTLGGVTVFTGFLYKSQLRAFAVMNLGIFLYGLYLRLKNVRLSHVGIAVTTVLELIGYAVFLTYMYIPQAENLDFAVLLFVSVSVLLTMSFQTPIDWLLGKLPRLMSLLGTLSLYMYICHIIFAHDLFPFLYTACGYDRSALVLPYMLTVVGCSLLLWLLEKYAKPPMLRGLKRLLTVKAEPSNL